MKILQLPAATQFVSNILNGSQRYHSPMSFDSGFGQPSFDPNKYQTGYQRPSFCDQPKSPDQNIHVVFADNAATLPLGVIENSLEPNKLCFKGLTSNELREVADYIDNLNEVKESIELHKRYLVFTIKLVNRDTQDTHFLMSPPTDKWDPKNWTYKKASQITEMKHNFIFAVFTEDSLPQYGSVDFWKGYFDNVNCAHKISNHNNSLIWDLVITDSSNGVTIVSFPGIIHPDVSSASE